jgi:predicted AAA+ superfamily ATPase
MAITNHERVGKSLDLLKEGLGPYVAREFTSMYGDEASERAVQFMGGDRLNASRQFAEWDTGALLKLMWDSWNTVFRQTLGPAEKGLVGEMRGHRNNWAHQQAFSGDETYRVLDSAARLLTSVSAPQAEEIETMKMELLRLRFDEQVRGERRKSSGAAIESAASATLKPWREVVTPHDDVASGRYQQAEFAADLWQVHLGQGTDEYRDPVEFFRRTYLTESLKGMLVGAVRRLSGQGGDPVIQLQTNFGGGKTHSMLALYHLFSGTPPTELAGVDGVMSEAGIPNLPAARRPVLVGNKISPGNPTTRSDGTVVRTLWGELAYQLGGKPAFDRLAADDERATNPGDVLRELFLEYGPCLILIDEWVAYARQLHDQSDLTGGSFETQFTFAQALTESAKLVDNCLLVISLPASDTAASPHATADDIEVGGERGRQALDRLRNVIGRVESSWRPASTEEGFEIVRRRLFQPLVDPGLFKERDVVARAFAELYRTQHQEFPPECRDVDYEKRIKAAYPIHPEVFDRLYNDWSSLVKFQRTRGVLRLMAAVINSLWEKGDRNPLILPANVSIDDPRVQFELTRYLPDNWLPVIEKDVDGPNSLPVRLDSEIPNLGKFAACRRVGRTIYLGSAPTTGAAHRGLEDRRIKLGCVMPGESPALFGDALRRLAGAATYLYQDGQRYWYSTQPTVTKLAEDRAEQLKRDPDKIFRELDKRLREDLRQVGDFSRVHPMPQSGQDVPDDLDARLVVLSIDHTYSKDANNAAETAARAILASRGNSPRLHQNALVFLAADATRLQDLDQAVRQYLAWESILSEKIQLDLTPQQVKQADTQLSSADSAISARLPETYQWLLVPTQTTPQTKVEWQAMRLSSHEPLAVRASRKLRGDELLLTTFAGTRLRMELDKIPLWRDNRVEIKQLAEDFARYIYLPRLKSQAVLAASVQDGLGLLLWEHETFAFADSYDETAGRYRGLRGGQATPIPDHQTPGLLVKPEVARAQLEAERPAATSPPTAEPLPGDGQPPRPPGAISEPGSSGERPPPTDPATPAVAPPPTRFHGTVVVNTTRLGRDAGQIAEEIVAHLAGLSGAEVTVTVEIEAKIPSGAPENVVRTVTENSRALGFTSQGFERDD